MRTARFYKTRKRFRRQRPHPHIYTLRGIRTSCPLRSDAANVQIYPVSLLAYRSAAEYLLSGALDTNSAGSFFSTQNATDKLG